MNLSEIMFSIHDYFPDGEIRDSGIFLHFGDVRVKVAGSLSEFEEVASRISNMVEEINRYYGNKIWNKI